jgi:hypothetical protein
MFAGVATSGISDFLDVPPPGATIALSMPMITNAGSVSSQSPETSGIISEVTTVSSSDQIATLLRPNRSITEPTTGAMSRPGIAVKATTSPALVAVPVISSAIQGIAINTMEPEMMLVIEASCKKIKGVRLRVCATSGLEAKVTQRYCG